LVHQGGHDQKSKFQDAHMMVVMSAKNECVEYQRLQRAYDDAIILWEQERYSNVQAITPFEVGYEHPTITSVTEQAQEAGLEIGDAIEPLNGEPYWGRALFQKVRFYARVGDTMRLLEHPPAA
jgi:hypothetical protein